MFLGAFYVFHSECLFLIHFIGNGSTKHPLEERLEVEGSESSDGEFDVKSLMI